MSWAIEVTEILGEERLIREVLADAGMYIVQGPTSLLLGGEAFAKCPQPRDARHLANRTSNKLRLVSRCRPELRLDFRVSKKFFEHANDEKPTLAQPDPDPSAERLYRERHRVATRYFRFLMSNSIESMVLSTIAMGAPADILVTAVDQIRVDLGDSVSQLATEAEFNEFRTAAFSRPHEATRFALQLVDKWLELKDRTASTTKTA